MEQNNRNIKKSSGKKRKKPKVRFSFGVLLLIFVLSFAGCFLLYMSTANFNADFFKDEFESGIIDNNPIVDDTETTTDEEQEVTEEATPAPTEKVITNPVPQSGAADATYFENSCLVTDSTLLEMASYTNFKDVLGNWQLSAATCTSTKVESSYGTVTIYETIKIKKPVNLYIMLGSDLGISTTEEMLSSYTSLVSNLHSALPDMNIYIMQLPPVIYDTETKTNEMINGYNAQLLNLANNAGIYCIDTNTALKSESGILDEQYWSYEDLTLSSTAYTKICEYILTHTA